MGNVTYRDNNCVYYVIIHDKYMRHDIKGTESVNCCNVLIEVPQSVQCQLETRILGNATTLLKGTIRWVRVILNHRPVISRFNSDHVVVSDLIGHCVDHAHYPSTVPHVITRAADLLTLVQPQRTRT